MVRGAVASLTGSIKEFEKKLRILLLLFLPVFFYPINSEASIQVIVTDSITGEGLPLSSLTTIKGKKRTFITDSIGKVILPHNISGRELKVAASGYEQIVFNVPTKDTIMFLKLGPAPFELQEVYVKPKREKYSKKNNPAVDFVNKLRNESGKHNPADTSFYSYDTYEKTLISLNNFNGKFESGFMGKSGKFLENYVDTSPITGARLLNLILKEKSSTRIISNDPDANKEVIHSYRSDGIDEVLSQDNIKIVLEDVVKEIDVYKPSINLLQNRFVSPLAPVGPDFYKYYLTDTVYIGDTECIELSFVPKNAQSMGFNGKIYVAADDTTMFVKKITMRTPRDINLNFLKNMYVNQSFIRDSLGKRHKTFDDVVVEMQVLPGTPNFYGRKTTAHNNFSYEKREDLNDYYGKLGVEFNLTDSIGATAQFWDEKRMVPMSPAESKMINMTKEMRKVPLFYWVEKFVGLMESGYVGTSKPSKVDLGPLNTFLSYSSHQGIRLRLGGMTTSSLNPHLFLRGYVAYGTKSREWRYGGTIEYSFPKKKRFAFEWPRHGFYASYAYDMDYIGQHYLFTNQDNLFLSLKRRSYDPATNRKLARGGYVLELPNNFSIEAGFKFAIQYATTDLKFQTFSGSFIPSYRQATFNVSLRWAKGEKFIQGRSHRLPVNMDPWIIQLTHEFGPKGFLGSAYTTNTTEFSVQKRFWFSAFGYLDAIAKAGKIWSPVYFTSLLWPNANLSYTIQPESYSLMDPMEFANDAYAAIDLTYFGNGVLFNRIPLINRLKLREAVTFKGLMGTLSDRNNPTINKNLLRFPEEAMARKMKTTPYMEIGVGIDNILSVLRVDYVWRLTYRDVPGIDKSGVRISVHFTL